MRNASLDYDCYQPCLPTPTLEWRGWCCMIDLGGMRAEHFFHFLLPLWILTPLQPPTCAVKVNVWGGQTLVSCTKHMILHIPPVRSNEVHWDPVTSRPPVYSVCNHSAIGYLVPRNIIPHFLSFLLSGGDRAVFLLHISYLCAMMKPTSEGLI